MKWISHQICTFAGTYAISDNLPLSFAVSAFSCLPDAIEFGPGKYIFRKHRGISHNPLFWLGILVISCLCSYLPLIQQTEDFLGKWNGFSTMCVLIPATGAFFHLAEDAMSKSGIPIWKGKMIAVPLYKTGTVGEFMVVLAIFILCLIPIVVSYYFFP
ncbi:MAG: metal-dependent hydrolase [Syntrophales bacterium]